MHSMCMDTVMLHLNIKTWNFGVFNVLIQHNSVNTNIVHLFVNYYNTIMQRLCVCW